MPGFFRTPMARKSLHERQQAQRWMIIATFCLLGTMALTMGVMTWGVYHDQTQIRLTMLQADTSRVRSHCTRTVLHVQDELATAIKNIPGATPMEALQNVLSKDDFFKKNWERTTLSDSIRLYTTIVGLDGRVIVHSDPSLEGKQLEPTWYDRIVDEADDDDAVVETHAYGLTKGTRAFDVHLPIVFDQKTVADYHSAINADSFEQRLQEKLSASRWTWGWLMALILAVEIGAGVSLFAISRRVAVLNESVKLSRSRRFAEMGQLMTGIVHEIRNPLNAMRLNLHVLNRSREKQAFPSDPERDRAREVDDTQLIRETNGEIERVEGLLRVLLGYARPDIPRNEDLEVRSEIEATLAFLKLLMERAEILVRARFPDAAVYIHMDRDRFRQILLNLLGNAREAMEPGGTIDVRIGVGNGAVEISVADDGPGIPSAAMDRIFEPFYSTKETGTGLGLA